MERKESWSFEADTRPGDMLWGFLLVWSQVWGQVWHRLLSQVWRRSLSPPSPESSMKARAPGKDEVQDHEKGDTCWGIHHQLRLSSGVRIRGFTIDDSDQRRVTRRPVSFSFVGGVLRDRRVIGSGLLRKLLRIP